MCDINGGKILASGGFGCVFSPPLKCIGKEKNKPDPNTLSKLMLKKNAIREYDEILAIRKKLKDIPNYENYFLVNDFTICQPAKLSRSDLSNYSKKCKALKKHSIKKKNINKKLNKLMMINMPNGGIPVDDYIQKKGSFKKLFILQKLLVELLTMGILPMNGKNIYHSDIKDSNVLIDVKNEQNEQTEQNEQNEKLHLKQNEKLRLIDWGLSTEYIPFEDNPFPRVWRNRPLQFNLPFSNILFTDDFVKKYSEYLKKGGEITKPKLHSFLKDYIEYWFKERGLGHYKYINETMFSLFRHDHLNDDFAKMKDDDKYDWIEKEITMKLILNYLVEVLLHFTAFREDETLNMRVYLDNVFIHILDVWGFISVYIPILTVLSDNYNKLNSRQKKIFDSIKHLFIDYLYTPTIKPINIKNLEKDLLYLSELTSLEVVSQETNKTNKTNKNKKLGNGKTKKNKKRNHIL